MVRTSTYTFWRNIIQPITRGKEMLKGKNTSQFSHRAGEGERVISVCTFFFLVNLGNKGLAAEFFLMAFCLCFY